MSIGQAEKAERFRALHAREGAFVIPNPWDAGSARILAGLGFEALATSSGACAGVLGRRDGGVTRDEALEHARAIVAAVELPVSADLERCFADAPEGVAETIRLAAGVGLVGASVEDATGRAELPLYPIEEAAARVRAAAEAAHGSGIPFVLTARAEGCLRGQPELDGIIARLRAYEAAGADVLMAPGLPDLDAVRRVCAALTKPFNFMAGIKGRSFDVAGLAGAGVKRVSLATSLYRAAMTGLVDAAREVKETGGFGFLDTALPTPELNRFMQG